MAAPIIKNKRSSVAGKVPTTTALSLGEFGINTADGKVYISANNNVTGVGTTVIAVNPWSVGLGSTAYNTYFTVGNVGIGTTTPTQNLDVSGNVRISGALYDSSNQPGAANEVLISTGTGIDWTDRVNAKTIYETVKNVSGSPINKGTPVYQVGMAGNSVTVGLARADDPNKHAVGVMDETIADQAEGRMLVLGEIKGVNTASFNIGDEVYLGETGGYTNVAPTASGTFIQFLGIIFRVDDTNGSGYITGTLTSDKIKYQSGSFYSWDGTSWQLLNRVSISTNTTNLNQLILYTTGFGNTTGFGATNSFVYNPSSGNLGIGVTNPQTKIEVDGVLGFTGDNVRIGNQETGNGGAGVDNITIGVGAGTSIISSDYNVFIGSNAGRENTSGGYNVFIGQNAGYNSNSIWNIGFGVDALRYSTGNSNLAIGYESGVSNTSGEYNIFFGNSTGEPNETGSYNLFLGHYTGNSVNASYKVIIGSGAIDANNFDAPNTTKDKQFAIGINSTGTNEYWLVGNENFNIGIGTTNPTQKLEVGGTVKATSFIGDGSGITGITASGTAIQVQNDGVISGLATAINFADNLSVTFSSGVARVSGFSTTAAGIFKIVTQYTATAGQTTFSATYVVGYVDVYMNGVRLSESEYTATNGTSIILDEGASVGDVIDIVAFSVNLTSVTNSTNVIGGIGSITQLQVTGVSTFTNGPVLIGSATSTGTSAQRLQVTGGAYVSGSVGIGTTIPANPLHISGSAGTLLRLDGGAAGTGTRDILITESNTTTLGGIIRYDSAGDLFTFGTLENSNVQYGVNVARATGNVGIDNVSPTAMLHVGAATTSAVNSAPFKLTSGGTANLLTNPEEGAVEYDGAFFYNTPNTTTGRAYIPPTYSFRRTTNGSTLGTGINDYFTSPSSLILEASSAYKIQCFAYFTKTTAGIGTWTQTFSSAPTIVEGYHYTTPVTGMSAATAATYTQLENYFYNQGTTTFAWNPSATTLSTGVNHLYKLDMTVYTNASTNWRLRFTNSAGTITPLAGSFYTIEKVGSTTGILTT